MTTIDHKQAAVDAVIEDAKNHRLVVTPDGRQECNCGFVLSDFPFEYRNEAYESHVVESYIAAAAPHLRAAWEKPIRELCEAEIERANGPLAERMFSGQPFPAMITAEDVLALLEGGAE